MNQELLIRGRLVHDNNFTPPIETPVTLRFNDTKKGEFKNWWQLDTKILHPQFLRVFLGLYIYISYIYVDIARKVVTLTVANVDFWGEVFVGPFSKVKRCPSLPLAWRQVELRFLLRFLLQFFCLGSKLEHFKSV